MQSKFVFMIILISYPFNQGIVMSVLSQPLVYNGIKTWVLVTWYNYDNAYLAQQIMAKGKT